MDSREFKYYRDAVENHWDPQDIDLEDDVEGVMKLTSDDYFDGVGFDILRKGVAMFGAGEKDVTEDLSPLAVVLDDIDAQMFVTTQLYEESKHAEFFDRYWSEVINEVERRNGMDVSDPTEDRFLSDKYNEIFEKNELAMSNLLENSSPKDLVNAYSHYHLIVEGVLAQTGYWAFQKTLGEDNDETPNLPGLLEGFVKIRGDESRHVGFGLHRINENMKNNDISMDVINTTAKDLLPLIQQVFMYIWEDLENPEQYPAVTPRETMNYIQGEHSARMEQIKKSKDK
jgi:ribonucleoside-diphosphate reductase beta chain